MQEVARYDPNRKPSSWMEVIQPGQYAAFFSDIESGAEITSDGDYFNAGMIGRCLIFDSLEEAEQYCCQKVEDITNLRCDVFDSHGRANPPVATFANRRHQHRLDSQAESRRLMRWGLVSIATSCPLFWFAWTRRGEAWIAAFFGLQLVIAGLRVLHWGYSLKEELRYRKAQSDLRKQQTTAAKTGRS
ncbi:MAG: hypothetical protein ACLQDM_13400 [Bradyrhizobium sp.]|nr:hypothetical protein [Terriglobales bacterium]